MKNIQFIIVEDEENAAKDLIYALHEIRPEYHLAAILPGVQKTVEWIKSNPMPQLGFFDIHLEDGDSFDIFNKIIPVFPIIFTTAFDEYAIKAFKVNSIDYLLKPILKTDLEKSLQKFETLIGTPDKNPPYDDTLYPNTTNLRSTILVSFREKLIPVEISQFAHFFIENGNVYGTTFANQLHVLDSSMEELERILNPGRFVRANRQYIINRKAIMELENFFNGRLLVRTTPSPREPIIVSKAKATEFKRWLERSIIL
jgi:two-component system LytT family response regulator